MAVYFIQEGDGGAVKIGTTVGSPLARLAALQTGNSKRLTLLGAIDGGANEECALHRRFSDIRLQGEWFAPEERLLGFIDGLNWKRAPIPHGQTTGAQGLSPEQIEFILGMIDGALATEKIRAAVDLTYGEEPRLSASELCALHESVYLLSQLSNPRQPPERAEMDGRRHVSALRLDADVSERIADALSRHSAEVARSQDADASCDVVTGSESTTDLVDAPMGEG